MQKPGQPGGLSLHGSHSHPIPAILCFSGGCQPPGISSSIHQHHTCRSCCHPPAEKPGASRQTYSPTSRQSSPRSRSSRYTSGQHKPRIWGCCSRTPGILEGCGASHLQGHTHRTAELPQAQTHCLKQGWHPPKAAARTLPLQYQMGKLCRGTQEGCPKFCFF